MEQLTVLETINNNSPEIDDVRNDFSIETEIANAIIITKNLSACYWQNRVLHNIHMMISDQAVTAIMGPSGCGKSTLIRIFNHTFHLTPGAKIENGTVLFRGIDLYSSKLNSLVIRKRIGIIHQRPLVFPMSILDNVLFGADFYGYCTKRERIEYAEYHLERVGLWSEVKNRLRESATKLSVGQQQRLCLARTLANQPEVLLMDEPCSALDPIATAFIEELIGKLKKEYPVIIVTHNMSQAKRISDSAVFLFEGRVIEQGATVRIFNNPQHQITKDFIMGKIG